MAALAEKLRQFKSSFDASTPTEILETINRSISLFQQENVCQTCLITGSTFPSFTLNNLQGNVTELTQLVQDKPLVITFIRGGWCPYCVLEMQAWQSYYKASFEEFNIVAITPEFPEFSSQLQKDNNISFPILIDKGLQLVSKLGLVWSLDADMQDLLLKWNIDLTKRSCETKFNVPIPATFVIDKDLTIKYRFIEEDYTIRAEPSDVIKAYQALL